MNCELCGSEEVLFKTSIEGSEINVCKKCARFGKIISEVKTGTEKTKKQAVKQELSHDREILQITAPDYGQRVRSAREALGLNQEEFAKKINEKVSLVHNIEIGHFEPSINLARKLEKFLKIKLIEQYEETHDKLSKTKGDSLTIGDLIKVKK